MPYESDDGNHFGKEECPQLSESADSPGITGTDRSGGSPRTQRYGTADLEIYGGNEPGEDTEAGTGSSGGTGQRRV